MTKILIVDDDEAARYMMRMTLRKHASQMWEAPNASTGLQMIKEHRPDVIVFDIEMPGTISGIHACEMVTSEPDVIDPFVVIVSGRDEQADFDAAKHAGANAYFVKPFKLHRLAEVVANHQDWKGTFLLEKWYF